MKRHHQLFVILTLALLCFPLSNQAQNSPKLDSLRTLVQNHTVRDTSYWNLLSKLEIALMYTDAGTELINLCKTSIHVADSLQDTFRLAKSTNMLANSYKISGLNDKAMKSYLEALELFEVTGDQKWLSNIHSNIGTMFLNKGDLDQAQKEQDIALSIRQKAGYYKGISGIFNSLGNIQDMRENADSSLYFYTLALDSSASEVNPYNRALYLGNIGNSYGSLQQYDKCLKFNRAALRLHLQMGLTLQSSRDYHNIGEAYFLQDKLDSAKFYLKKAYQAADSSNYHMVKYVASKQLIKVFRKQGAFEEALNWSEIAFEEKDSLHQNQIYDESRQLEMSYRVEQQEREVQFEQETALLQKDEQIKRQRILNISMGLGIFLLAGFGFVVSKRYREKKQVNALLEKTVAERTKALRETNTKLTDEVSQKEKASKTLNTFIYRSSHDLKGPLTSILGLVNVAKKDNSESEYIDMIASKTKQLDAVLQQLIDKVEVDSRTPQHIVTEWKSIWDELHTELNEKSGAEKLAIECNITSETKFNTDPVLLKLALRQILINAIDFNKPTGFIKVDAKSDKGKWTISIQDNGVGIPPSEQPKVWEMFYRGSNGASGAGLGLYLAKEAALKMGAQISLESEEDKGTTVSLELS